MACAKILERTSGLEPSSETTPPRYLKLVTVPSFCPFTFISLDPPNPFTFISLEPANPGHAEFYIFFKSITVISESAWVIMEGVCKGTSFPL